MSSSKQPAPYVDVYMDQMIYSELAEYQYNNFVQVDTNKPDSLLNRFFTDVFGLGLIYAGTFIICDVIRGLKTGEWTRLYWMFLGPWNFITGTPRIKKIHEKYGRNVTATDCENAYLDTVKNCALFPDRWYQADMPPPDQDMYNCMTDAIGDYGDCMRRTKEGLDPAAPTCVDRATSNHEHCIANGQTWQQCHDKYIEEVHDCQDTYLPESCYLEGVEKFDLCVSGYGNDPSRCETAYYTDLTNCMLSEGSGN